MVVQHLEPAKTAPALQSGYTASIFAQFASSLTFEDIPAGVVEKAKLLLLDTIGIAMGSVDLDFAARALSAASELGGTGACTIIGQPGDHGAHASAFVNGVLSHGQDFDDTHTETLLHPSCVLVPALLAAGERGGVSGKEALVAFVAAAEITLRLALAANQQLNRRGFQTSAVAGSFGSAVIAARCAQYDLKGFENAIGLAGSVVATGIMECVPAGASAKQVHPGWAAHCGIMAADLARAGFTGPASVFEGPLGVFNAYLNGLDIDLLPIISDIGSHWEILNVRPKLYPCGHPIHAHIECALAFRAGNPGKTNQIESVECFVPAGAIRTVCEPWKSKVAPENGYDVRFSLPFSVAMTLEMGALGLDDFSDKHITNLEVLALARKVKCTIDPDLKLGKMPGRMRVTLADGTRWQHALDEVRGGRNTPISKQEILTKFDQNTRDWPGTQRGEILQKLMHFEELTQLRDITATLRG